MEVAIPANKISLLCLSNQTQISLIFMRPILKVEGSYIVIIVTYPVP